MAILVSIISVFLSLIIVGPSSTGTIIYAIILNTFTLLGISYYDNKVAKKKNSFDSTPTELE